MIRMKTIEMLLIYYISHSLHALLLVNSAGRILQCDPLSDPINFKVAKVVKLVKVLVLVNLILAMVARCASSQ